MPDAPPPLRGPDTLVLLCRHAEQRSMRTFDTELSERGRAQARRLDRRLAGLPVGAVVASPLRRAIETATTVAARHGLEVEVEEGLEEIHLTEEERARRYTSGQGAGLEPEMTDEGYRRAALTMVAVTPFVHWSDAKGAETLASLRARGLAAIDRVIDRHPGRVVVVVSHGGWLNAVLGAWLGIDADLWFTPWHTGISAVAVSGGRRIVLGANDASHLVPGEAMLELVARATGGAADAPG